MKRSAGRLALAALAVAAAMTVAGCSSTGGDTPPETSEPGGDTGHAQLIEAAKAEGSLVWYTGSTESAAQALADAFTDEYGIAVTIQRLTSAPLAQRVEAEVSAQNVQVDVFSTVNAAFFESARANDWSVDLTAQDIPSLEGFPAEYIQDDGASAVIGIGPDVIVWNTEVLPDYEFTEWEDLIDPALKDNIILTDPRSSQAWAGFWSVLLHDERYGPAFIEEFAAQGIRQVVDSSVPGAQLVGSGEGGVLVGSTVSTQDELIAAGAPLEQTITSDPAHVYLQYAAIATEAPHPNAARLFLDFALSEKGQSVYNEAHKQASVLGDIPGAIPLPEGVTVPDPEQIEADLPEVLRLLGL
ncbi:ABC transporter substrate-binding protein [Microbacterium sp. No. 7]|uniref:ABC transporter substrate-binding protein n=1 Tax=Microbacterium sp. No. 7 TaxID=1714373 RepID=UPI0006D15511|nr:extracellular solute-binding protein [Microbacterium sp. No. 7]ALJ18894.1 hypothetical protein AOA12_02805 [Microbacterium sp. No. 7]